MLHRELYRRVRGARRFSHQRAHFLRGRRTQSRGERLTGLNTGSNTPGRGGSRGGAALRAPRDEYAVCIVSWRTVATRSTIRAALTVLAVAGSAHAGAPAGAPARRPAPPAPLPPTCTPAAIADVLLSRPVPIDEIRVVVAEGSPAGGAAEVVLESGTTDRVLRVRGGSHDLKFFPAVTSAAFRVSLSPVFEADRDACVSRIELRRGGAAVATVIPR